MKATFENSLNILVQAFLLGKLTHRDCKGCVVGNLLGGTEWLFLFVTLTDRKNPNVHKQEFNPACKNGRYTGLELREKRHKGAKLISESGYTKQQLAKIEFTFETTPKTADQDQWMFDGLMRVVDVLAEIHNVDLSQRETAKQLFVKV